MISRIFMKNFLLLFFLCLSSVVFAEKIPLSFIINQTPGNIGEKTVEILPNEDVYIDGSANVGELIINGHLSCDNAIEFAELKAKAIFVNGRFDCGSTEFPFNKKLILSLKHNDQLNPKTSAAYRGLIVNKGGALHLHGLTNKAGIVKLNKTAEIGERFISLRSEVNWQVGDEILLAPTSYSPNQGETFRITGFDYQNPKIIYLNNSIQYKHWGESEIVSTKTRGNIILDQSSEVTNLTRNILIRSDESAFQISGLDTADAQLGGHVMVTKGGFAYVDGVEFYRLGQAGVMGRYPFHWHLVGDATGQYIKNSSIHRSFQRCITIHGTNNALIDNNSCYDFKGHGVFFELGNEINNRVSNNIVVHAQHPTPSKYLLASDNPAFSVHGRFPAVSSYWISHPQNTIVNNIAAGSVGSGFWMSFASEIRAFNSATGEFDGELLAKPLTSNTTEFSNNTAHSTRVGMTWDGAPIFTPGRNEYKANNPNNREDRLLEMAHYSPPIVPVFKKLVNYKNLDSGIYFRGKTVVFQDGILADNGWGMFLAFNQIVKDFAIIGRSRNNGIFEQNYLYNEQRYLQKQVGIVFYDGPLEADTVDFLNYPISKMNVQTGSGLVDITPVPFMPIPGAAKYTNLVKNLSFSPEPFQRMHVEEYNPTLFAAWAEDGYSNATRDLDGSFTGTVGGLVVFKSNYISTSQCLTKSFNGQPSFEKFKICPPSMSSINLWLQQDNAGGKTPFIIRRSDGEISIPMEKWAVFDRIADLNQMIYHNKNRLLVGPSFDYEILLRNQVTSGPGALKLGVMTNSEYRNQQSPVFKLSGFGSRCQFNGATAVDSLDKLRQAQTSTYYSNGDQFYFRIFSQYLNSDIVSSPYGSATEHQSGYHQVVCNDSVVNKITGYIDDVKTANGESLVTGWACDYGQSAQIDLHMYVGASAGNPDSKLIATSLANLTSESAVAFACGDPSMKGHRFAFKISSDLVNQNNGKKIYIHGISKSGKDNLTIAKSGSFAIGGNGEIVVVTPPTPPAPPTPTPTPPTPPAPNETIGTFCSGKREILWSCGISKIPSTGWKDVGGGCYHKDNGVTDLCTVLSKPEPGMTQGKYCTGRSEILWICGVSKSPGKTWKNVGGNCFHKDNGISRNCK